MELALKGEINETSRIFEADDVGRHQALHLLTGRAVLTRAVCRELLDFREVFKSECVRLPLLSLLSRWVKHFSGDRTSWISRVGMETQRHGRARSLRRHMLREIQDGAA